MAKKTGRNEPCPCGSGRKYKKCCIDKKPRSNVVYFCSSESTHGFHYDKEKMELTCLTGDDRLIEPLTTFSQTSYKSDSGKEVVLSRVYDKVITNRSDLLRYLSTEFDHIVGIDTNTRTIAGDRLSVASTYQCTLSTLPQKGRYGLDIRRKGDILFRNCPTELSPEKLAWKAESESIINDPQNVGKRFALVTDHDRDNHQSFTKGKAPIWNSFYLPQNITLLYGRADSSTENILNYLVKVCDKRATDVLNMIEKTGYYQHNEVRCSIDQIPIPRLL